MTTKRDGAIVTVAGARRLIARGWRLSSISQTIDGIGYWLMERTHTDGSRLVPIGDCDDDGLHPTY